MYSSIGWITTWWREFRFQMPGSSEIPGGKCWDKEESWLPRSLLSSVPSSVQKLSEIICHQHFVERTSSPCCPGVMDGLSQLVETNPAQHGVFKWFGLAWRSTLLKVKWNTLFLVSLAKNWLWLPGSLCVPCSMTCWGLTCPASLPGSDSMKNTHPQASAQTLAGKWMETRKPGVRSHCFSNSVGVAASVLSACQGFTQVLLIIASIWQKPFCPPQITTAKVWPLVDFLLPTCFQALATAGDQEHVWMMAWARKKLRGKSAKI